MSSQGSGNKKWLLPFLGGGALIVVVVAVLMAVLLPLWVTRWLGGDQFRQLAARQISLLLQTEGELQPLEWSSFSVYSPGFASRKGAPGPWLWSIKELRTEVSPRLLLDRVLRFSEISIDEICLTPGNLPAVPATESPVPAPSEKAAPDIFRDVQVGAVEIRSIGLRPCSATSGWGVAGIKASIHPTKQKTDFSLQKGELLTPYPWIGNLQLLSAKGRYTDPAVYLTMLEARSTSGGSLQVSGEYLPSPLPKAQGKMVWDRWPIPGGKVGIGLFEISGLMSGDFVLQELRGGSPVGQGQVCLVDARLDPGKGSETILALLGVLTGEPRLRGCPISTAQAQWSIQPGICDVNKILMEAPGLLRAAGQVRVTGKNLNGQIDLGLEKNLGSKVNALTGGQCFYREEDGYLYEAIKLSGTLENPQNDLKTKLVSATAQTAIRTGAQILEKAAGSGGGGDAAKAAGQILNSLFGAPPK